MFSRRNLLGAVAGLLPTLSLLKLQPTVKKEEWDENDRRLILLPNHCYMYEYKNGKKEYYFCGMLHREGEPAVTDPKGTQIWYHKGEFHRTDGPAWIDSYNKQWYQNGKFHRIGGPAKTSKDGSESWWLNGKRHREDGPAIISKGCSEYWYQNDRLHREDGPAVIRTNGEKEWWIKGKKHRLDGPAKIGTDGDQYWFKDDECHRVDGPAVIYSDGSEAWYKEGCVYKTCDATGHVLFYRTPEEVEEILSRCKCRGNT